jgi:hypothetical protein
MKLETAIKMLAGLAICWMGADTLAEAGKEFVEYRAKRHSWADAVHTKPDKAENADSSEQ